ncbi:MAG: RnfABCDGE type electron transport complex subunit D [Clostridia bacterium]|nr:RnfABCDGE type electron transport complex subunit D [Clostridia bacterium]
MKFIKENGPHIKSNDSTSKIMTRFLIALTPIICFAIFKNSVIVYSYASKGFIESLHPLFMIIVGALTSFISETLYYKIVLKNDLRTSLYESYRSFGIISGILLALVLPPNIPLWLVSFGSFTGSIIGKMLFGGFGQNIFNPALLGYLFISASYSNLMGSPFNAYELDTIGGATPLSNLMNFNYTGSFENIVSPFGDLFNLFVGNIPGAIGEVSKLLIIISFIYLVITKTIKWIIPTIYVTTVFILTFIISKYIDAGVWYSLFHILSGGLLFGAVFMATDPVTSPLTTIGQILHGLSLGILTVLLRFLTPYPEGVMTSILFMNMLVPLFDKIGIKARNNIRNIIIIVITFILIIIISILNITHKLDKNSSNVSELDSKVNILEVKEDGNKKIYEVTSKGWGLIKADVEVEDKNIKSIIIKDSKDETQWNEIEKNNYIYKVIQNQNNIDKLDAVSGSTYSSNALKNIVKKVKIEEAK